MKARLMASVLGLVALLLVGVALRSPGDGQGPSSAASAESDRPDGPAVDAGRPAPSVDLPPIGPGSLAVSLDTDGTVDGVVFADEDIIVMDGPTGRWSHFLDGSDLGFGSDVGIDGFHLVDDGRVLISLDGPAELPGAGPVDGADVIEFSPTSVGSDTAGALSVYFDGSEHGLDEVDAVALDPDGNLLVSTGGTAALGSVTVAGHDVLSFDGTTLSTFLLGPLVDLSTAAENVTGLSVDRSGVIHVVTAADHEVPGAIGDGADVLQCVPTGPAPVAGCDWSRHRDGSALGLPAGRVVGLTTIDPVNYFTDFSSPLGSEWIIYDSVGHAGWGLRRPSAIGLLPDPMATGGGMLTITARMGQGDEAGRLVSGGVKLLRPQTYGRFTVRLRADPDPDQVTSMVALLWPQSDEWPRDGEIDIVETWSTRDTRNPVESNLHWLKTDATEPYTRRDDARAGAVHRGVAGTEWHTYVLEWRADIVSVSVDGIAPQVLSTDPAEIADWNMEPTLQLDAFDPPYAPGAQPRVSGPVVMYVDYLLVQP